MWWISGTIFLHFIGAICTVDLIVHLPNGAIQGKVLTSPRNKTFRSFQGIPYAAPPVGALRFQAPQPPRDWIGVKETTMDSNTCFSVKGDTTMESEDCLYMNVFTPLLENSIQNKLPVMLWIYGGAFVTGSARISNFGPDYLIEKDVVIATFNYRTGPFGFLATDDGLIPGNAGLKDQAAAIKWVHDNIALFGGDPGKVTLYGQSAGGASVGYQLLYKKNQGYIHGAILQSGSPLNTFSFMGDISPSAYAFDLASKIDSRVDLRNNTRLLKDFLLKATGRQIDKASTLTTVTQRSLPIIEKNVEGAFLTKESYELLEAGDFLRVPIMIGTTSEEEVFNLIDLNSYRKYFESVETNHKQLIPNQGFHVKSDVDVTALGETIYNLYFGNVSLNERLGHYVRYNSDNRYSKSVIKHADLSSNYIDVYLYIFSYDGLMGEWNITVPGAGTVGHGEDNHYMWKIRSDTYSNEDLSKFPTSDIVTLERVVELWTNFAKYQNPTPVPSRSLQGISWPKVKPGNLQYLDIGSNLVIKKNPRSPYYEEWTRIYNAYNKRPFTTF